MVNTTSVVTIPYLQWVRMAAVCRLQFARDCINVNGDARGTRMTQKQLLNNGAADFGAFFQTLDGKNCTR